MKALIKAAGAMRGKAFTDWRGGGWQMLNGYGNGMPGQHPAQVTRSIHAYGGTEESSSAVFACTVKIANELAGYPKQLTDAMGDPIEPSEPTQELFDLMDEPAPELTYFDWVADVATDLELVGNSFWLKDKQNGLGQPQSLERFDPASVVIVKNDQDQKIGYGVHVKGRIIPFGLDDIVHYRTRNPLNPHRGMGTVEAIYREVNAELAETAHISSFFFNGARLAGVLVIPEELSDGQFAQLQQQVGEEFGGPHNAYRTLIATGASDYKPISATPVAAGVVEVHRQSLDAIYKGFGMPEFLLGGVAQGGVFKMSEAQFILYRNMLPKARRFQERTTLSLTALWGGVRFMVKPELSEPPAERMTTAEGLLKVGGSLNEAREHAGLPRLEDPQADVPLAPAGMAPYGVQVDPNTGEVRQLVQEPLQVPRRSGGSKSVLPVPPAFMSEAAKAVMKGRNGTKDADTDQGGDAIDGTAEEVPSVESPKLPAGYEQRGTLYPKAADLDTVQTLVEGQAAFFDRATPYMANGFRDLFRGQRQRTLARLQELGSEVQRDIQGNDGKGVSRRELRAKKLRDIFRLFPLDEEDVLVTHYLSLVDDLGEAALDTANRLIETGVSWDQQHTHIWAARDAIAKLVTRINETTRTFLAAEVELGISRGYSIPQIANGKPEENYGGIIGIFDEATSARADTIARTETAFLYNAASTAAYREDGIGEVEVLDGNYDEACEKANGQTWTLRQAELNPIEHPNCVRAFAPLIGKSASPGDPPGFAAFVRKEQLLEPEMIARGWLYERRGLGLLPSVLTCQRTIGGVLMKYDPNQPRNPEGASGGIGGRWRSLTEVELEGNVADAFDGLPVALEGGQKHSDPDELYSSAEEKFPSYVALMDDMSQDLEADTFTLYDEDPSVLDKQKLNEMGEAIGSGPDRNYVIIAHRKEREAFTQKVKGKYGGDASSITDLVRGSLLLDDPRDLPKVMEQLKANCEKHDWEIVEAETTQVNIDHPNRPPGKYVSGYRDSKVLIRSKDGEHVAEIQLMATRSWIAKDGPGGWYRSEPDTNGHALYEAQRNLTLDTPEKKALWSEMNNRQRKLYAEAWKAVIQRMQQIDKQRRPPQD